VIKTNPQQTIVLMFTHVEPFFWLLDHHGSQMEELDFTISAYERSLREYLQEIEDGTVRVNINRALSVNNLNECGFLTYVDKNRGAFNFQPHILDTLRALDSKRIRELGQPDLDFIHSQVLTVHKYYMSDSCCWIKEDLLWQEQLIALKEILHDTLARIDRNVRALEGSANRLAAVLDKHHQQMLLPTDKVRKALVEVQRIYDRNIIPTLTFLTPGAQVDEHSAMNLIQQIHQRFSDESFFAETHYIATVEMRLLSYSEKVAKIRKRMHQYLLMDQKQRQLFEAVESRFNELYGQCLDNLDQRINKRSLAPNHPIFERSKGFYGLNRWNADTTSFRNQIEWPENDVRALTLEHIRVKQDEAVAVKKASKKHTHSVQRVNEADRQQRKRIDRLMKAMEGFEATEGMYDVYKEINSYLLEAMDDYQLPDIYDALPMIDSRFRLKPLYRRDEITLGDYKLSYMIKSLEYTNEF